MSNSCAIFLESHWNYSHWPKAFEEQTLQSPTVVHYPRPASLINNEENSLDPLLRAFPRIFRAYSHTCILRQIYIPATAHPLLLSRAHYYPISHTLVFRAARGAFRSSLSALASPHPFLSLLSQVPTTIRAHIHAHPVRRASPPRQKRSSPFENAAATAVCAREKRGVREREKERDSAGPGRPGGVSRRPGRALPHSFLDRRGESGSAAQRHSSALAREKKRVVVCSSSSFAFSPPPWPRKGDTS